MTGTAARAKGAASLEALQAAFCAGILGEGDSFAAAIRARCGAEANRRLAVYAEAYRARLLEALQDSYGHTAALLGADAFAALAQGYIAAHPSRDPNIRWYGDGFADWLRTAGPGRAGAADLAALDWALRAAFDGPDSEPLSAKDLAGLGEADWARAGFDLQPTVRLLRLRHNVAPVWQALDCGHAPPALIELRERGTILVWRRGLAPHYRSLDRPEADALDALAAGEPFARICARQAERMGDGDAVALTGQWLQRWLDEELLAGIRL